MSDKPLLYYFEGRGRAETIRITLCLGGVEFDQKYLQTREEFLNKCDDNTFLFRCVPYLKWGDFEMVESLAIARYVASKTGMMGKDAEETARINMMYDASRDFYLAFLFLGFVPSDAPLITDLKKNALPKFLPIFNKILADNGTGFVVGDQPSLADAGLLECLLATEEFIGTDVFQDHKAIQKFLHVMKSLPNIENYLNNVRLPPNTPEYVTNVRGVLDWTLDNKKA